MIQSRKSIYIQMYITIKTDIFVLAQNLHELGEISSSHFLFNVVIFFFATFCFCSIFFLIYLLLPILLWNAYCAFVILCILKEKTTSALWIFYHMYVMKQAIVEFAAPLRTILGYPSRVIQYLWFLLWCCIALKMYTESTLLTSLVSLFTRLMVIHMFYVSLNLNK